VYGIGAVSRMLDTTTASLRAWEERYGVVIPVRSPGDQRLYSRDQVDQLRYVQHLIESGLHAGEAHRLLALRLDDGMTLVPRAPAVLAPASILLAERDIYAAELVEYLLRTEGYEVIVALDAADTRRLFDEHQPTLVFLELLISGGVGKPGTGMPIALPVSSSLTIRVISAFSSSDESQPTVRATCTMRLRTCGRSTSRANLMYRSRAS
jgi:DNA-binding transcriptional MerR regulator